MQAFSVDTPQKCIDFFGPDAQIWALNFFFHNFFLLSLYLVQILHFELIKGHFIGHNQKLV